MLGEGDMMNNLVNYYQALFDQYGHTENALGWTKNKQNIRFEQLFRFLHPLNGRLLDLGCGFGDMLKFLKNCEDGQNIKYFGVDIMSDFIKEAQRTFMPTEGIFVCSDFFDFLGKEQDKFDYIVASGIFGLKLYEDEMEQYNYIKSVFELAYDNCEVGFAMNFLSDKVDYHTSDSDFHASPSRILDLGYGLSRNVILDNGVMPFEFCITIFKDDSFSVENTLFFNRRG